MLKHVQERRIHYVPSVITPNINDHKNLLGKEH